MWSPTVMTRLAAVPSSGELPEIWLDGVPAEAGVTGCCLAEFSIVAKPSLWGEPPVGCNDQALVRHKLLGPMWCNANDSVCVHSERLNPSGEVTDMPTTWPTSTLLYQAQGAPFHS